MNRTIQPAILSIFAAISCLAADQTWTGTISDSMCGADHSAMAAKHGGAADVKTSSRDCTLACVKEGGKFVFVSKGKVYNIANQDFAGLQEHAGHTVRLTGEMTGDTIQASGVSMPDKRQK